MLRKAFWIVASLLLAEIVVFVLLGRALGPVPVFLIVFGTSVAAWFWISTLRGRDDIDTGGLVATIILAIPLPISTMMGLLGLVPSIRRYAKEQVLKTPLGTKVSHLAATLRGLDPNRRRNVINVDLVREDDGEHRSKTLNPGDESGFK